ncbi:MAG: glys dimeric: glycine--trna ligase, partial [Chthoniobacter sp.]|nr:glys dimeric: glycine--trna ligase [Chthoniobacter sp.]
GLDATIIMHPNIWKASGHVDTFSDPMVDCLVTKKRVRADHVEPQSGVVYKWSGATEIQGVADAGELPTSALAAIDAAGVSFSVLLAKGKPPESARKVAIQFYQQRGLKQPELLGETTASIENTRAFNPENGAQLTEPKPFNLMFHTFVGATATDADKAYLRPETAQAIFAQFKNVVDSTRQKVPFGVCQIGKAFRNEVTPRNFTFRSREFEQMELEFFIKPDEAIRITHGSVAQWSEGADLSAPKPNWGWEMWHRYWVAQRTAYYHSIGLTDEVLAYHWQTPEELAHYARACVDILFKFPFGTDELEGIAARGNFDLSQHQEHSGKSQEVFDEELRAAANKLDEAAKAAIVADAESEWAAGAAKKGVSEEVGRTAARAFCEKLFKGIYIPHVIEPSAGLDRLALAVLCLAYSEVEKTDPKGNVEKVNVMRFHPRVAPIKVAVFPLLKNKPELVAKARGVYDLLKKHLAADYDEGGSIGRRYARQDEAGTPFGVTIDFDTIGENGPDLLDTVTLRHRDDARQERVPISELLPRMLAAIS